MKVSAVRRTISLRRFFQGSKLVQGGLRSNHGNHGVRFEVVDRRRLAGWTWSQTKSPKCVVCAIGIRPKSVSKLNVDIERNRDIVVVLDPVGTIYWNMYAVSRAQFIGSSAGLKLRLVDRRIVIHCPKALNLLFRKNLAIGAIKDGNCLCSLDLEQEAAFTIDVIGCNALGRGDEDESIFAKNSRL